MGVRADGLAAWATKDDAGWRRGVWIDFLGAAALLALLGALFGLLARCS